MGRLQDNLKRHVKEAVTALQSRGIRQPSSASVVTLLQQQYSRLYRRMKPNVLGRKVGEIMAAVTESPPPPKRPRLDPTGATAAAAAATTVPAQAIPGAGTATGAGTAAAGDDVVMEDDGSAAIVLPTGDPTFPRSAPATGAGSSVAQGTPISRAGGSSDPTSGAAGASASGSLPRSSSSASLQRSLYAHKRAAARKKALQAVLPGASPQVDLTPPIQRFADMGGIESCIKDVVELVEYPLTHPEVFKYLGVDPPSGVLLHGPSGCGKTLLGRAIAGELGVAFQYVAAPQLIGGVSGESEQKIRAVFDAAVAAAPSIIFLDEVDVIAPKRESSQRSMDKRIVAQLLACWDSISMNNDERPAVIVLGATSRPDTIDKGLRRPGRFDREIQLPIPDEGARRDILQVVTRNMKLAEGVDFAALARSTPGYVGADLAAVAKEAAILAVNRALVELLRPGSQVSGSTAPATQGNKTEEGDEESRDAAAITLGALRSVPTLNDQKMGEMALQLSMADFEAAVEKTRTELQLAVVEPIRHPERYQRLGIKVPAGLLLYGPPGCGKTLLAKAVANESRANFISIKGPELLDKYVGESERAVRQTFQKARASAPCVVFFDELDALAPKRGSNAGASGVSERVVNQLLTELDGLDKRGDVFVIAATNRPDIIDSAMLRPGRLDKLLYVPLPKPAARCEILRTLCRKTPLGTDVDLDAVARDPRCARFSGADLAGLVREAALCTLRGTDMDSDVAGPACVSQQHFNMALDHVSPSVTIEDEVRYDMMSELRTARSTLKPQPSEAPATSAPDDAPQSTAPTAAPPLPPPSS